MSKARRDFNVLRMITHPQTVRDKRSLTVQIGLRSKHKDTDESLLEKHLVSKEPFGLFQVWLEEASNKKEILLPNAMCLSTVNKNGFPSCRYMMCQSYGKDGFKFFTNYGSRKAKEMDENPNVAATFCWVALSRSVRIEGCVEKMDEDESIKTFRARPMPSQIVAVASKQSAPIESKDDLHKRVLALEKKYSIPGKIIPKPTWGGYIIIPTSVEFWQGQKDHLSDRIRFRKLEEAEVADGKILHEGEDCWVYERLSP